MKGEVSQLVTLASAANGILSECIGPEPLYPSNAAFRFCNSVRFVDLKKTLFGNLREVQRHEDPDRWLRSLKPSNAIRASLTYTSSANPLPPDHQLAAFVGGGGEWRLTVSFKRSAEIWMPRWEVTNQDAPDKRIWRVTYGCVGRYLSPPSVPKAQLDLATSRLLSSLTDAAKFATEHDLPFWTDRFQRAIDCLDPANPVVFPDYVEFVCQGSYPQTAQRLLSASYNGWVFGGMGSWNDMYFEPKSENARYNSISSELYSAINDAVQQASWSFGLTHAA